MLRLNHGALLDLRLLSVNVRCSAYETGSSRLAALSKMLLKPNCVGVCVNLMGTLWKVANEYYRATLLTVHLGGAGFSGTGFCDEVRERWVRRVGYGQCWMKQKHSPRLNTSVLEKCFFPAGNLNLWLTNSRTVLSFRRRCSDASAFLTEASVLPDGRPCVFTGLVLSAGDGLTISMSLSMVATMGFCVR